jgi:hypothetical protein
MLAYMCTWHIAPHLAHCPNIQPYSARTGARIESKECRVHDNQGGECQPRRLHLLLLLLLLPRSSRAKKQPRGNRAKKQPPSPERSTHEVIEPRRQLKRCAAASCHTHAHTHTHTHTYVFFFLSLVLNQTDISIRIWGGGLLLEVQIRSTMVSLESDPVSSS